MYFRMGLQNAVNILSTPREALGNNAFAPKFVAVSLAVALNTPCCQLLCTSNIKPHQHFFTRGSY